MTRFTSMMAGAVFLAFALPAAAQMPGQAPGMPPGIAPPAVIVVPPGAHSGVSMPPPHHFSEHDQRRARRIEREQRRQARWEARSARWHSHGRGPHRYGHRHAGGLQPHRY
jgi:hypothetical protein